MEEGGDKEEVDVEGERSLSFLRLEYIFVCFH